jgi:hypothetical protein
MFKLQDRTTLSEVNIYSVRNVGNSIEFLVYDEAYGFVWADSSYYEPISE